MKTLLPYQMNKLIYLFVVLEKIPAWFRGVVWNRRYKFDVLVRSKEEYD